MSKPMPKAWTQVEAKKSITASNGKHKIGAKINMSAEHAGQGLCPDCGKPMNETYASDVPVISCFPCRISLPRKDSAEYVASLQAAEPNPALEHAQ